MRKAVRRAIAACGALGLAARPAFAYRPFVSTDASVAAPKTLELEVGYFGLARNQDQDTVSSPQAVLSWGLRDRFEAVGEFVVLHPQRGASEVVDAAIGVKGVLREGELQDRPGVSVAGESTVLIPSGGADEKRAGFEQTFIASRRLAGFAFHWNLGGGWEREASLPFAAWGLIAESPTRRGLRAVGELNGSGVRGLSPDNSGLLGLIWETGWRDVALDAGYRRGLSAASANWSVTAGFSTAFALK